MSHVNYIIADGLWPLSFNPEDSDVFENAVVMELVVGTLVRYEGTGRYLPFVAEKWQISSDGLKYTFYLRDNISTEMDEPITAQTYINNFRILLGKYAKRSSPPVFKYLVGFEEFMDGKTEQLGVKALSDKIIEFSFSQKVSGLFEFLAMPYFGYYSSTNFDANGNWIDKQRIVSSGPYKVSTINDKEVVLEKRSSWFSHIKNSPKLISVSSQTFEEALKSSKKTVICLRGVSSMPYSDNYIKIHGTPTILAYAVLSPLVENGIFKDEKVRNEFAMALRAHFRKNLPQVDGLYPTDSFYFSDEGKPEEHVGYSLTNKFEKMPVSMVVRPSKDDKSLILKTIAEQFFKEAAVNLTTKVLDADDKEWFNKFRSSGFADVRIGTVDIGGEIEDWVIRMMFCSNLGVSFPDLNQNVCKVTSEFENGSIDFANYKSKFEQVIKQDAVVVPLFHYGCLWLFTNDFDVSRLTPTMGIIPFDQVGVLK